MTQDDILRNLCGCPYTAGNPESYKELLQAIIKHKTKGRCFRKKIKKVPSFHSLILQKDKPAHPQGECLTNICVNDAYFPFLKFSKLANKLGAWNLVRGCCTFCYCQPMCCTCSPDDYVPRDADRSYAARSDMRHFDKRMKTDLVSMKIMYC